MQYLQCFFLQVAFLIVSADVSVTLSILFLHCSNCIDLLFWFVCIIVGCLIELCDINDSQLMLFVLHQLPVQIDKVKPYLLENFLLVFLVPAGGQNKHAQVLVIFPLFELV